MKRSSGIIVTGLSAVLLSAGAAAGAGLLTGETATTEAAAGTADPTAGATTDTSTGAAIDEPVDASSTEASPTAEASSDATADATTTEAPTEAAAVAGTYQGEAVSTRYGVFQAEITVEDGVLTAIDWLQDGEADHHSQRINAWAIPELEQAILAAQSTDVGYVSGASFTSEGVEDAVASAMQAAGLA